MDSGDPLYLGQVDIADCFHSIGLPEEFRHLFGLPAIRACYVGVSLTADGVAVSPTDNVIPCWTAVPMGWSHSLWVCQIIHERLVAPSPGLGASTRVVDDRRVPDMNPLVHTEYVDNFIGISQSAPAASEAADKVAKALTAVGFGILGPDVTCGGAALGWQFSDSTPEIATNPRRAWRLRLGILHVLERGTASGEEIEIIVGHLAFAFTLRRELLSLLSSTYLFMDKLGETRGNLWDSVRRELRW